MIVSQKLTHTMPTYSEQDKIDFLKNVRQWHHKFTYKLFNLEEIHSIFLADNEKFIALKDRLHAFNKMLQNAEKTKTYLPEFPKRYTFYSRILQLIREALLINSREVQSDFLDRIYNWYITEQGLYDPQSENRPISDKLLRENMRKDNNDKLNREKDKQNTSNLDNTQDPTNDETRQIIEVDDQQFQQLQMPSQQIQEELYDYTKQARTKHKLFEPPIQRLLQYKRRQFNSLVETPVVVQSCNQSAFPQTQQNQGQLQKLNTRITEEQDLPPQELSNSESESSKKKNQLSMVPNVKVFNQDRNLQIKKNHLNKSFEIKQNYNFYEPSNNEIELALQQRWLKNRHNEVKEKRQDEEMVVSMKQWSKNKARIEKEIDRRMDSTQYGSRYTQCDQRNENSVPTTAHDSRTVYLTQLPTIIQGQKKVTNLDISNLEQKIAQQKVNKTKEAYKNLLNLSQAAEMQSNDDDPNSLSIYATKIRSNSVHNKFSSLLQRNSPERINESQLAEVIEIKNRMAKYKIAVPIHKLIAGIMIPQFETSDQDKIMTAGQQMITNPFEIQKKTKGKSKKKRK